MNNGKPVEDEISRVTYRDKGIAHYQERREVWKACHEFLNGLKVPKRENFLLAFFAQTKPIWVCDLENKKIKKIFFVFDPLIRWFWVFCRILSVQ